MASTPYSYLGNCQILVCGIFSTSHLTISPLVASWLVPIGLLGSDMIWWGEDRIHRSLQQSVGHLTVCWGLKRNFVQLLYGAVTFILLAVKKLHKKLDQNSSPQTVQLPVSQWYGDSRVLGIPIPKILMIYSSPVVLTLTLTQITKVIWEGDSHIIKVGGCPYHCNTGVTRWETGYEAAYYGINNTTRSTQSERAHQALLNP